MVSTTPRSAVLPRSTFRWRGLAIALDVHDEKYADRVAKNCRARGLLLDSQENVLLMLPALNVDRATVKDGLDILEACA